MSWQLAIVYEESGKRFLMPFDKIAKRVITDEEVAKIKAEALKEVSK